ncbi:reverse transcriptase domain-containing protein [Acetobacterium paludosum]|nr:reverse transcriptase domain-containing protein [Acetobacterium paludosum]
MYGYIINLFMYYAFDTWISRKYPQNPWAHYADDGVIHCRKEQEAFNLLEYLKKRMVECGLKIHPDKTKIVYCRSASSIQTCYTEYIII